MDITNADNEIDRSGDAVVDLAMTQVMGSLDQRDRFREKLQDAVDALIDACRDRYREAGR